MAFEIVMSLLRRYATVKSRTASESQRRGTAGGYNQRTPGFAAGGVSVVAYDTVPADLL